jgi:molybdopterin converting factor small subunit
MNRVSVRLFASLRRYVPSGARDPLVVELREGATVGDVLRSLGIPPERAHMVVGSEGQIELSTAVRDGQELNVYPPLAGGSGRVGIE